MTTEKVEWTHKASVIAFAESVAKESGCPMAVFKRSDRKNYNVCVLALVDMRALSAICDGVNFTIVHKAGVQ